MEQEKTEKQFYEAPRPKTAEAPAAPDAFSRWADRAVRRVLLPKERRRVREELENHYQDRLDDYLGRGMSEQEARSRALDSLGDPEETAVLLGRVHKPWLILLVWAARVLFMLAALLMVLALLGRLFSLRSLQRVDVQALANGSYPLVLLREQNGWYVFGFDRDTLKTARTAYLSWQESLHSAEGDSESELSPQSVQQYTLVNWLLSYKPWRPVLSCPARLELSVLENGSPRTLTWDPVCPTDIKLP